MGENELMLVLGSTSEIAWATVQRLAQDKRLHWRFFLTGRNLAAVKQQAQQLAAATKQEWTSNPQEKIKKFALCL